jgi:hypothetical protein
VEEGERERELISEGKRCGGNRGWSSHFYRGRGRRGGSGRVVTAGIKAIMPLMVGEGGKEGGLRMGYKAGE